MAKSIDQQIKEAARVLGLTAHYRCREAIASCAVLKQW
jgi:hypothetical protein